MAKPVRYAIFKTKPGYFGIAANGKGLLRTCLPCSTRKTVENHLLAGFQRPLFEKNLLKALQGRIIAYFEGQTVKIDTPLALDGLSPFTQKVLAACRKILSGKTISYSQLASMIGHPRAGRAVGNALAKNPIPLVIPCHRVIHSDGSIGNFSAPGGTSLKKRMIALEDKRSAFCVPRTA